MREQVCIVLNEREASKAKAADSLEKQLRQLNITTSRLKIEKNIEALVTQRSPAVVILDYLLGDYSTGLDVMSAFDDVPAPRRPRFIFFTDEPSVQVAVQALAKGAVNYVELEDPQALQKLSAEVQKILAQLKAPEEVPRPTPSLENLVSVSAAMTKALRRAREAAEKATPVIVLLGPPGSGLSAVAQALQRSNSQSPFRLELDCRTFAGDLLAAVGLSTPRPQQASLNTDLAVILDHAEEESGEFIDYVRQNVANIWPADHARRSRLIICTNSQETARAWQQLPESDLIIHPSLAERCDDIPPLVQRFLREAEACLDKRIKLFGPEVLKWLSSIEWPGQLRELRAVVIDAGIACVLDEVEPRAALEERKTLWETEQAVAAAPLDPVEAAVAIELARGNYRVAAARLGCSVKRLHDHFKQAEGAR